MLGSCGRTFFCLCFILFLRRSECKCQFGNETYEIGEFWASPDDCLEGYICQEGGFYNSTDCSTIAEDILETKVINIEATKEFFSCCNITVAEIELEGCIVNNGIVEAGYQHDLPGNCFSNVCYGNNTWHRKLCPLVQVPEGWKLSAMDTSKPFPDCCESLVPELEIIPDILDKMPYADFLEVTYEGGLKVDKGKELTPTQVKSEPNINFTSNPSEWYLLCMVDPDAPSRKEPTLREVLHWLVGNIPGDKVSEGEVIAGYRGSGAPQGTGLHRYVFFVFKQSGKLTFDEPRVKSTSRQHRLNFSLRKFAEKYKLGDPIAFNAFQAQWDEYVPILQQMTDP